MRIPLVLVLLTVPGTGAWAQTATDSAAIHQAARDYIEGWYEGDAERMSRAVHPELVKRRVQPAPDGSGFVREMGASHLVNSTRSGGGRATAVHERRTSVRILDVFQGMAAVRTDGDNWVDYIQLARVDGRWKIINVLWDIRKR